MPRINETEWLDELARLSRKNDEGLTVEEWVAKLGKSVDAVRTLLRKANAAGWLGHGNRTLTAIDGRQYRANVYRIVRPKKGK